MMDVVAHRGDPLRHRENTLASVRSAVAVGATRVEIDVRTTFDGVSVVLHDRTLLRLWSRPSFVHELTWDDVARVGLADVRIPRLEEVADALAGTGVGLLVDCTDAADAEAAWRALDSWRAPGALEVHWCGAPAAMAAVRALDAAAVVHLNSDDGTIDPELLRTVRPTYLNLEGTLVTPGTVAAAREADLLVSAWTIDDPVAMAAMVALGADSVTTNRPGLLRRMLDSGELAATAATAMRLIGGAGPAASTHGVDLAAAAHVAADLAGWAASYLRESLPGDISAKAHAADLVTDVDRAVERRVREVLAAEFPGHVVVGEEEGGTSRDGVPTWYVDPVDGTTNYANGLGWSSFSLALAVDREPLVGAVADAWRGEVLVAVAGQGATRDGVPLRLPERDCLAGAVVTTEWAAHVPFDGQLEALARLAERHVTTRVMGSGTLSCAAVAAGRAAGCLIGDFHPEDHLAAALIAREAGAVVLDAHGVETGWPDGVFVVADRGVAAELQACCFTARR